MTGILTDQDFQELEKRFATKGDLKGFATKDDLNRFATKEDLDRFVTKDEHNHSVEVLEQKIDDRVGQATRSLESRMDRMEQNIATAIANALEKQATRAELDNLKHRVSNLERQTLS